MRALFRLFIPAVTALAVSASLVSPASAHERRKVAGYDVVVGFGAEPAYASQPNYVDFRVSKDDKPVVDIGPDLDVAVIYGNSNQKLELKPKFKVGTYGEPGSYGADFVPTRSGVYTFHFTGAINGQPVDEKFTASPTTFSEVVSAFAVLAT